jgi:predicted N-acetyltransferase YhbS
MDVEVCHLFEQPQHRHAAARLIHDEFWTDVPGASADKMAQRLALATSMSVPLALVALNGSQVVGAINLVESDDDNHPEWTPWLAGLVVAAPWRGRGIGSLLVRSLLEHARQLHIARVWFGTDGPGFYTRLGAVEQERVRSDFWFMRFDL